MLVESKEDGIHLRYRLQTLVVTINQETPSTRLR